MPLSALAAPLLALALLAGENFSFSFQSQTDQNGKASMQIMVKEAVNGVKVKVVGDDGSGVEKTVSARPGRPVTISWQQKSRNVSYELNIEAGEEYTNYNFDVTRPIAGGTPGPFKLLSDRSEIVDDHKIRYETPFTLSNYTLKVYNTDGDQIVDKLVADQVIEAGDTIELSWDRDDEIFMVMFRGEDDLGRFSEDKRVPWSVEIPHTEVHFDSGKSIIKDTEAPKVDEAFAVLVHELDRLEQANKAVNGNLSAQLYIVGYTDTVGNNAKNQVLSQDRAKAIANYFAEKGTWCEIYYAGMGERGLAVQTGDSVDEVRNRRALYLLGVQKPAGGGQVPGQGAWKKLRGAVPRTLANLPPLPESYLRWKEEKEAKRTGKSPASAASGDSDGGGADDWGKGNPTPTNGGEVQHVEPGESGGDAPPELGGEPGASAKGCQVGEDPRSALPWLSLGLLGLVRRRRSAR